MIGKSKTEYVAFELFRQELLRRNPRTTDTQIRKLWARGRKSYWRERGENAIRAIARWEECQEIECEREAPQETEDPAKQV